MLVDLFLVHFSSVFLFVSCGGLSWLHVSFLPHIPIHIYCWAISRYFSCKTVQLNTQISQAGERVRQEARWFNFSFFHRSFRDWNSRKIIIKGRLTKLITNTPKRSFLTNLLEFFEYVTDAVDNGKPVDVIISISKRLSILHVRLLHKVAAHGISGNIGEWLNARQQRVVLNENVSAWVYFGTPVVSYIYKRHW